MALPSPAAPKRNSGHTGRRRLSEGEAALRGPKALCEHRRLYGRAVSADHQMAPPPSWFTSAMAQIWQTVLATAPAGVLHKVDHANLVVLVRAIHTHNTLAAAWLEYQVATPPMLPPAELERRMRMAAAEVNRASMVLGLTPGRRPDGTEPEPEPPSDPFFRFGLLRAPKPV